MAGKHFDPKALLRDVPVRWILFWLLIPNIGIIVMWPIGGPEMRVAWSLSGGAALVLSQLPWRAPKVIGLILIILASNLFYVACLFGLPTLNPAMMMQFLSEVRPMRSLEYLAAGLVIVGSMAYVAWHAPRVPRFSAPVHYMFAFLAICGVVMIDKAVTASSAQAYELPVNADYIPVDSAVKQVNVDALAKGKRNVMIIVVEALGIPVQPEEKALFQADWVRPEWNARYDVAYGKSKFYGSTTYGEMRELCGRWVNYYEFDFDRADCLPGRMAAAGYETSAIHAFGGAMFGRDKWYPKLKFENIAFGPDLEKRGTGSCYGVFPGACDTGVTKVIHDQLKDRSKPQFVYWLTLNTHYPVMPDPAQGTQTCDRGPAQWRHDFPMICRMAHVHRQLADAITQLALSPDLPPMDILIVGDHAPRFIDRDSRMRFDQRHVPWIYLKARDAAAGAGSPQQAQSRAK